MNGGEPTAPADSGSVSPRQPSGFPPVVETYWRRRSSCYGPSLANRRGVARPWVFCQKNMDLLLTRTQVLEAVRVPCGTPSTLAAAEPVNSEAYTDASGRITLPSHNDGTANSVTLSNRATIVETLWRRVTGDVLLPSDGVDRLRFGRPIGRGNYAHLRNARKALQTSNLSLRMAEREGFEPSVEFPLHTLSKRAPSTTRPSLRSSGINSLPEGGEPCKSKL
jgi:hypothetical protein